MAPRGSQNPLYDLSTDNSDDDNINYKTPGVLGAFNTVDEGIGSADSRIGQLQSQQTKLLQSLSQSPDTLNGAQVGAASLLATLPLLIGAGLHGSRGVEATAPAAIAGAGGYLSGIKDENDQDRRDKQLQLKAINEQISGIAQQKNQLQMEKIKETAPSGLQKDYEFRVKTEGKDAADAWLAKAGTGNQTNINLPSGAITNMYEKADKRIASIAAAQNVFDAVADIDPTYAQDTYKNPDGTINFSKIPAVALDQLKAKAIGSASVRGEINQAIGRFVSDFVTAATGASRTDAEFTRLAQLVQSGGKVAPEDIPSTLRTIARLQREQKNVGRAEVDLTNTGGRLTPESFMDVANRAGPGIPQKTSAKQSLFSNLGIK